MTPYLILIAVPILIWVINDRIQFNVGNKLLRQTKSLSIDVFMMLLLFLLAFRGISCGIDTSRYLHLYEEYNAREFTSLILDYDIEIGYKLLNKIIGVIFNEFQVFLVLTSFLCVCPLWYFYKNESEIPPLTIALFLTVSPFVMYFSGIRQAIAMSMGVFAWYAAKNKKILLFIFIVLIAMQFHTSAFILIVLYPLYHVRITKKWLWFVLPGIVGLYIFKTPIFDFFMHFLWKEYETTGETGAFMIFLLLIIFAIYSYVMVNEKDLDQDTLALRNILLLSVAIQIFAMLHPLSMRMNYYFLIFVPVLIPKIATNCKKDLSPIAKLSFVVMIVYFFSYFVMTMINDNDNLNVFPYVPFWENP